MTDEVLEPAIAAHPDPGAEQVEAPEPPRLSRWRIGPGFLELILLLAIVAVALVLRFQGIRWGTGYYLHPDELFMTDVLTRISAPSGFREYLDSGTSPLNPFNLGIGYIYGTFPLFLAKLVGSFTDYTAINNAQIPGRWLSAIADTGTVVLVWWIGRMLWNRWTGLLAALLMAFTALNLGAAHYFTTDSWSAFFATAAFASVLASWKYQRWMLYAVAGAMVGLAAASKPNLLVAFGFLALPALEAIRTGGWRSLWPRWRTLVDDADEDDKDDEQRPFPVLLASALSLLVAVWVIRIAQPYTFEGPSLFSFRFDPRWLAQVEFWRNAQSGALDYYPGLQWTERPALTFQLKNLVLWGMGPGLGIAALGGLAWQLWSIVVARRWPSWFMLGMTGWICFHLIYYGIAFVKTQRYLLPAYPLLVVLAAAAMVASVRWAWRRGSIRVPRVGWTIGFPRWAHPGLILPAIAVASTVFYGTAFVSIYTNPQTRVVATEWIVENVPDGSTIANEYWDLGLPVGIPDLAGHTYPTLNLDLYGDENPFKLTTLIGQLQHTDYIVLSSHRLRDSIPRLPWRYPMATRYYEALYSGELGFDQVAHFTSFPELFGVEIDDRAAEETLTVYDHPEVTIFRKSDRWDAHAAWYLLDDALGHGGLNVRAVQTQPDRMMLDAADQQVVRTHSAWSSAFDPGSITNRLPVLFWYLALQILALPMAVILRRFLPWLPDRGYAISKTIGLFAVGWLAWWISTLRLLDFGVVAIGIGWLVIFGGAIVALRWRPKDGTRERVAPGWMIATEVLFLAGYLAAVWLRAQNPDLWTPGRIGTQLQNMATFNAMSLTPFFPAYDPWLSDGTIHDFTFGYMPWAVVTRLTGIVPESAYSLALASLAALVIVNAWLAACVLIAHFHRTLGAGKTIASGLLGPGLLLGIGSWGMAQRVGSGDWGLNFEGTVGDALAGLWKTVTASSEALPGSWHTTDTFVGPGVLEFPLLSYLTGELAIQQLAMPIFLAGLVVLVGYLSWSGKRGATEGDHVLATLGGWRGAGAFLLIGGLVAGWTLAANPLFGIALLGLAALLLFFAAGANRGWSGSWSTLRDTGLAIVIVGTIAILSIAPFLSAYGTFATTRTPLLQPISVNDYVGHTGVAIVVAFSYLIWQLWSLAGVVRETEGLNWPGLTGCGVLLALVVALAFMIGNLSLLLLLILLLAGVVAWYRHDDARHLMLLGMLLMAVVLSIVANRMTFATWTAQQNIPLQFSLVSWILLAVIAAPIIVLAFHAGWEQASVWRKVGKRTIASAWAVAMAVLVGAGGVYPVLGFPDRGDDRLVQMSPTIDSFAFMESGQLSINANGAPVAPYDLASDLAAAIWMREHLNGLPTILEAPIGFSGWGGRISALTGFPTVIGVTPVQLQQRPGMERLVTWRYTDVTTVYTSEQPFAEIEPILQDYGVQIIYVGALERATYPATALARFDQAVADGELEVLYQQDDVTIYHYDGPRISREPHDP